MVKLIIFDVDGTLTETKSGGPFRQTAADWQWLAGRLEKCEALREQGIQFALASNQAGVAFPWSKFTQAEIAYELDKVASGIRASWVGVCYSSTNSKALPDYYSPNDTRRKPGPGMLLEAMEKLGVAPGETLMVGDRTEDEQAALAAGVSFVHADLFFAPEVANVHDDEWIDANQPPS